MSLWHFYVYVLWADSLPVGSSPPSPCLPFPLVPFHGSTLPSIFHVTRVLLSSPSLSLKASISPLHATLSSFQASIGTHSPTHKDWKTGFSYERTHVVVVVSELELPHSIFLKSSVHFPENSIVSNFLYSSIQFHCVYIHHHFIAYSCWWESWLVPFPC